MAKINWVFQDESGTNLNRYIATNVETREEIIFDLLRGGNISVVGTPLNAEKLNELVSAINSNYDEIISLKNKVSDLEEDVSILQSNVSQHGSKLEAYNNRITANTNDIAGIKSTISGSLSGQVASALNLANQNKTKIAGLDTRLQSAEATIIINSGNISANAENIEVIEKEIEEIKNKNSDQELDIANIETRLDELGFKEGTFSVGDISSDYILANKVIKQGKTCIFSLFLSTSFTTTLPEMVIPFPFEIVPKETINFTARGYGASSNIIVEKVIPMQISAGWGLLHIPPGYYEISFLNIGMEIQ